MALTPSRKPVDDVRLSLTSYEAATLHLLAAVGLRVYEGDDIAPMTLDLLDRIPPGVLKRAVDKIGGWAEGDVH
jgi:hypothetical protein